MVVAMTYPYYLCQAIEHAMPPGASGSWISYHRYRSKHRAIQWFEGMLVNIQDKHLDTDFVRVVYKQAPRYHVTVLASYGPTVYVSFLLGHAPLNLIQFAGQ